jgi:hypothetical protein
MTLLAASHPALRQTLIHPMTGWQWHQDGARHTSIGDANDLATGSPIDELGQVRLQLTDAHVHVTTIPLHVTT